MVYQDGLLGLEYSIEYSKLHSCFIHSYTNVDHTFEKRRKDFWLSTPFLIDIVTLYVEYLAHSSITTVGVLVTLIHFVVVISRLVNQWSGHLQFNSHQQESNHVMRHHVKRQRDSWNKNGKRSIIYLSIFVVWSVCEIVIIVHIKESACCTISSLVYFLSLDRRLVLSSLQTGRPSSLGRHHTPEYLFFVRWEFPRVHILLGGTGTSLLFNFFLHCWHRLGEWEKQYYCKTNDYQKVAEQERPIGIGKWHFADRECHLGIFISKQGLWCGWVQKNY